ncbi:MAG: hypothetical protein ACP5QZ_09075 [Candidatus Sumerlaeaceae bacterium]|jgi:hypothetical protein
MARNVWKWTPLVAMLIILSPQQMWAYGARSGDNSILTLPERLVYGALAIPGKIGRTMFPRTTANVGNYTRAAERTTGQAVRGTANVGKKVLSTTGKVVEGTVSAATRAVSSIAGTVIRAARSR